MLNSSLYPHSVEAGDTSSCYYTDFEVEDCEVSSDSDNFDDPVTYTDSDTDVSSDSETSCSSIDDIVQNDDFDVVSEGELWLSIHDNNIFLK